METQPTPSLPSLQLNGPVYGWLLLLSTLLTLVFIAHHPMADIHDRSQGLQNIMAIRPQQQLVHGAMVVMVLAFATGFQGSPGVWA